MKRLLLTLLGVFMFSTVYGAQQLLISGENWGTTRGKINSNDTELYTDIGDSSLHTTEAELDNHSDNATAHHVKTPVSNDPYGPGWDGDNDTATKDAIYNKIESIGGGSGDGNVTVSGTPTAGQAAIWTDASTVEGTDALGVTNINLEDYTIQGAFAGLSDNSTVTLLASQMNAVHLATATSDWDIPTDMCDNATASKQWLTVAQDSNATISITSNDAADRFQLSDGTLLDVGDELDLAGAKPNFCYIVCMEDNVWWVIGENGTCADGGVAD